MHNDEELQHRLEGDAAQMLRLIAQLAPAVGFTPDEIARVDQLAAHATASLAT